MFRSAILLMIARSGVPAVGVRIGAQLRHAEGERGAGEGVPVPARADEEIGFARAERRVAREARAADRECGAEREQAGGGEKLAAAGCGHRTRFHHRSEEPTSELQSLKRSSYAVFCLK